MSTWMYIAIYLLLNSMVVSVMASRDNAGKYHLLEAALCSFVAIPTLLPSPKTSTPKTP